MSTLIQNWIVETFVATTILMLIVLVLRSAVAERFGARAAYLLWLAPALRMIMPPLPQSWFNNEGLAAQGQALKDAAVVLTNPSAVPLMSAASAGGIDWLMLLGIVWLGGAALFFARHMLAYHRFLTLVLASSRRIDDANRITLVASPAIRSPIALGVFGRQIIVPDDFTTRFDATEQRLALAHEMTHHRRGDLPVNLAALVVLALHWFNPLAHIAHRAFRLDQEAACDAIVLHGASVGERHAYGSALFKAAIGPVPIAICAMGATTTLKARLRYIIAHAERPERIMTGAVLALAVIGGGLVLTASTSFASDTTANAADDIKSTAQTVTVQANLDAKEARDEARQAKVEAEQALVEAELEAQTAIREAEAEVECPKEARRRQIVSSNDGDSQVVIITCDGRITTLTNATTRAEIGKARAQITAMRVLAGDQRTAALKSLDAALARMRSRGFTLQ
ncbi:MAG: M56 family metallopeptidase [Pseudomonadota bacterium]